MSQEKLNHVVTGVLYDFMKFLTTRKEQIVSSLDEETTAEIGAIQEFLLQRNIKDAEPLFQWEDRCSKIGNETDQMEHGYYTEGTLY